MNNQLSPFMSDLWNKLENKTVHIEIVFVGKDKVDYRIWEGENWSNSNGFEIVLPFNRHYE